MHSSAELNRLLASIPAGTPGADTIRVFDPACGLGGSLLATHRSAFAQGRHLVLVGADWDPRVAALARMRLALAGADAQIFVRDSLAEPAGPTWDLVVCQPPASPILGLHGETTGGPAAWLDLVANSVRPGGQALVVLPGAALTGGGEAGRVRQKLVAQGKLEAVAELPAGLIAGSAASSFLLVISGAADPRKEGRVLVADLSDRPAGAAGIISRWAMRAEYTPTEGAELVSGHSIADMGEGDLFRPLALAVPERLLTGLRLQNFKAVSGVLQVPLRPLTLVYGRNSAGKSSLLQALLLLQQSVQRGAFAAAGQAEDLGSFAGLVHNHDLALDLGVGADFVPGPGSPSSPPAEGGVRGVDVTFEASSRDPSAVTITAGDTTAVLTREKGLYWWQQADAYFHPDGILVGALAGRSEGNQQGQAQAPVFRQVSDQLVDLVDRFVFLGPLRQAPERFSRRRQAAGAGGSGPRDMPFFLLDHVSEREAVSAALQALGVHYSMDVVNPISPEHSGALGDVASIVLRDTRTGVEMTAADVGFGVSQVLPIVTELSARTDSVIMVQQPEIHLHPRMQAELADLFIESTDPAGRGNQIIAETHSETLIMRLQRRIREGTLDLADVLVLYVDQDQDGQATVKELRLDSHGDFLDAWPGGFFDDQLNELFF